MKNKKIDWFRVFIYIAVFLMVAGVYFISSCLSFEVTDFVTRLAGMATILYLVYVFVDSKMLKKVDKVEPKEEEPKKGSKKKKPGVFRRIITEYKEMFKSLKEYKHDRKKYFIKPCIHFECDRRLFIFSIIPVIVWEPWVYRHPGLCVVSISWLNFNICIGEWKPKEVK